jgi:type 1 glutamine amidotransferase
MKKALIVRGGWEGHEPGPVSEILAAALRENDVAVEISETLASFEDEAKLASLDLIVPIWTMGTIERNQLNGLLNAVRGGVGIAGVHGGMGDAFRQETEFQYMVGGQWVAHPGNDGVRYTVEITDVPSPITAGLHDFEVTSEHYFMHVDPGNTVLAITRFGDTVMPVTWTKMYGKGRVFYCSLGHVAQVFEQDPQILTMVTRGMLWAAEGKALAEAAG